MRLKTAVLIAVTAVLVLWACASVAKTPELVCVDAQDGRTLFTSDDIVRFDWDDQFFELKRETAMELMAVDIGQCRGFEFRDREGVIYQGGFWSSFSSSGSDRPAIRMDGFYGDPNSPPKLSKQVCPPLYRIDAGYPGKHGKVDLRFDPRLRRALEKAGVLVEIDDESVPRPVEVRFAGHGYEAVDGGLRIHIVMFPETLRIGGKARIHISFVKDKDWKPDFDVLSVEMNVSANGQEMKQEILNLYAVRIGDADPNSVGGESKTGQRLISGQSGGWQTRYVCSFDNWGPGARTLARKPTTAKVSFKVQRKSKTGDEAGVSKVLRVVRDIPLPK